MGVQRYSDPLAFLNRAEPFLLKDEAERSPSPFNHQAPYESLWSLISPW